jgi:hypothetical protein
VSETLRQRQSRFAKLVAHLILYAYDHGYEVTFSWAYRPEPCNTQIGGHPRSLHTKRLAIDLNLFHHGRYLTSTLAYEPIGLHWESLDTGCRWGGRWGDGNHFSMEWEGMS